MTTTRELGTIEKVDIREVWPTEDGHFTPWLGENLVKLGADLGMDLELVETEAEVGTFKLDVRAHDANTKGEVVIENQFGQTNHSHLGQLLTYASGFDAQAVVWIAESFRDEHKEALDFLNHRTGEDTQFFGVEIETWRIGDSLPAPHFNVVATPNEWRKQGVIRTQSPGNTSERGERYRAFFQVLIDTLRQEHNFTNARKAQSGNWRYFSAGHAQRVQYGATLASGNRARVELYIDNGDKDWNKGLFDQLIEVKTEIESECAEPLEWERLDTARASRIAVYTNGSIIDDTEERLAEIRAWMVERLLKFKEVFGPRLVELVD